MNIFKRFAAAFLSVLTLSSLALCAATPAKAIGTPSVSRVKAACVYCLDTGSGDGAELFSYNMDAQLYPTSSTKIMTAIVAIETLKDRLDETVTLTSEMLSSVSGNRLGLEAGEVLKIRDLIYILVTGGNNDAAVCLAYICAGSVADFVNMMNEKAYEITGRTNTHYTNPTGLHDDLMVTTAEDTFLIAKYAWETPGLSLFREASSTDKYPIDKTNMSEARNIFNRNCFIST